MPSGTLMVKVVRNSVPALLGASAGSFGCGASGVTSSVRHTRSGMEAKTSSSWPPSAAANSPSERHSPGCSGGRHRRVRCPAAASSREWAASRARMSVTAWSGVPSGTWVVMLTRYSMAGSSWRYGSGTTVPSVKRDSTFLNGQGRYGPRVVGWLVRVVHRVVAGLPVLAEAGRAQVRVRADLAGHLAKVAAKVLERGPAPEPVAVVDAEDDQSRLEHERVRDHRVVVGVGVLLDVEVLLDLVASVGQEGPLCADRV